MAVDLDFTQVSGVLYSTPTESAGVRESCGGLSSLHDGVYDDCGHSM